MKLLIKLIVFVVLYIYGTPCELLTKSSIPSLVPRFYFPQDFLDTVKQHEGIEFNPYNCSANHTTIGAGHILLESDVLNYPLSDKDVDSLLLSDLWKNYNYLKVYTPIEVFNKFTVNQKLALTKLIFHIGIGNYNKSKLKQLIENNQDISDEWLSWCYYTNKSGNKIYSDYMVKLRKYELNLYNYENK
jgi:GH24 family phage-related lysozyme (muramidase)